MTIKLPAIPGISPVKDQTVATILRPMKESIELLGAAIGGVSLANPNTSVGGVVSGGGGGDIDPTVVFVYDYTPPPAPQNLSVGGAFQNIILTWDTIPSSYKNHAYAEIWRATTNAIGAASLVGFSPGSVYVDAVGVGKTYYYWVRFRSTSDVTGSFNAISGTLGSTSLIGGSDLSDEIITAEKIASGAIDLSGALVTGLLPNSNLATLADSNKFAAGVITGNAIAPNAIGVSKFASGIEPITIVTGSLPVVKSTETISFNGKLYRWNGTAYTAAVDTGDLTGTISTTQLADGSITTIKLGDSQVTTTKLADGSISSIKFSSGIQPVSIVSSLPSATGYTGPNVVFNSTDGKLYRYASGVWTTATPTSDLSGQITSTQITDNAVTTAKIAANAVTASQIAANTITANQIAADTITSGQIAVGAITASKLAAGAVVAGKIAAGTIVAADIAAATITGDKISASTITGANIAADTITAAQIAAGAINASELAANAVTAGKIAAGAIIANDGVIANAAIGSAQIQNAAITSALIGSAAVGEAAIQNAAITNAKIANLAVDNAKIANVAAGKITSDSIAVGQYIQSTGYVAGTAGWRVSGDGSAEFANVLVRGTVEGSLINGGTITGGTINGSTITGATVQTATTGQRIVFDSQGLLFLTGVTGGKYGSFKYGAKKYGIGVLVYFNNANKRVPFYVAAEQNVADIHLYNRGANPTGATYEAGDMICVNGRLKIYVPALGGWKTVALEP